MEGRRDRNGWLKGLNATPLARTDSGTVVGCSRLEKKEEKEEKNMEIDNLYLMLLLYISKESCLLKKGTAL